VFFNGPTPPFDEREFRVHNIVIVGLGATRLPETNSSPMGKSSEDFRMPEGGSEMSSWVNGIAAITLFTTDLEETKEFYRKV
jgi:hypothetical protein